MKEITLKVPDTKLNFFMELVNQLGLEIKNDEVNIPLEQQQEVQRRLELLQEGKMKTRSWSEAKQDIFKP
ncbi:addiction module protein [Brumimicrobium mesophilum]|uniref:addiction module protein n=1 Tax=Brumimicrobium mesophilum TaxID=392717 RepID=UPI000D141B7B|nr:addiction module protein [Brumimicrobium mesophilum]